MSFNPLGHLADDGLTAFLGGLITEDPPDTLLFEGPFTVNYEEDLTSTQGRFGPWLERVIVDGLNAWRRTL